MAVKVKLGGPPRRYDDEGIPLPRRRSSRPLWKRVLTFVVVLSCAGLLIGAATFGYYYLEYQQVVDDRLALAPCSQARRRFTPHLEKFAPASTLRQRPLVPTCARRATT